MKAFITKNKIIIAMLLILGLAVFFRFAWLTVIPPGIHPDAAANALDAWNAFQTHHHQVFYEANKGREGLFINFISYSFQWFGPSLLTYKLPGCLLGVLSVLGIFFLAYEVTRKKYVGLLASFLMAISFWMVVFDRMGLRAVFSVFCVTWTSYFFLKSLRTNKWYDYALAGIFLGLGLNSYIAFRLMPIAVVAGFVYKIFLSRKIRGLRFGQAIRAHKKFILIIIIAGIIVTPLGLYYFRHPDFLTARTSDVSVFGKPDTLKLLGESVVANLGIFNFSGDPNWRHNVARLPILDVFQGLLFILGIIITSGYVLKKQPDPPEEAIRLKTNYLYILTVFAIMIVPAAITNTPGGIPHSLRIIDTAPSVFILVAIAFVAVYEKIKIVFSEHQRWLTVGIVIILSYLAVHNTILYFVRWGGNSQVAHEYSQDFTNLSEYINEKAEQGNKVYVVSSSSEVDFFTLTTPNLKKASGFDAQTVQEFKPSIIIYTDFKSEDSGNVDSLVAQGWKVRDSTDFGQGKHAIKILAQ